MPEIVERFGKRAFSSPSSFCNRLTVWMPASSLLSIREAMGLRKVKSSFSMPELMTFSHFRWNSSCSVEPVSSDTPWSLLNLLRSLTMSETSWLPLKDLSSSRLLSLSSLLRALYCSSRASSIYLMPPTAPPIPIEPLSSS